MRHKTGFNRLGLKTAHRKAMMKNMVTSLFKYEKIETTKAKAKEAQRIAEKMITRAKVDSVHNRRTIAKSIGDKAVLAKLFTEIGPRFKERNGGYTSILKLGFRQGDAAEMVLLRLVEEEEAPKAKKKPAKKAAPKVEEPKAEEPKAEEKAEKADAPKETPAEASEEVKEEAKEEAAPAAE